MGVAQGRQPEGAVVAGSPGLALLAVLCLLWPAGACSGPGAQSGRSSESEPPGTLQETIDEFLARYVEGRNFSGVILVARSGEVLANRGYGFASRELAVPNDSETRFQIGSISKSFTAAAVLLLHEEGRLDLEDPVSRYLGDFPRGDEITIHHLLAHESGLPRLVFLPDYAERSRRPHSAADLVTWIRDQPLAFEPGEGSAYSNANYAVVARLIELVSEQSYGDFVRARILRPLGLDGTGHRGDAREVIDRMAFGYVPVGLRALEKSGWHDYSVMTGAGSLYSTSGDLLKWYRALAGDGLLEESSRDLMFGRSDGGGGYAWGRDEQHGRATVSAGGWDGVGFSARLVHYLEEDLTIVVLCNLNISGISAEIADHLGGIALGLDRQPPGLGSTLLEETELEDYAGVYRFGPDFYVPDTTMRLIVSDGQLLVAAAPGAREGGLLPLSQTEFIYRQHWSPVSFERGDDGRVTAMNYGRFKAQRLLRP